MSAQAARHDVRGIDTRLDPRQPAGEELFLSLPGGVEVCVQNDLASVTTYVLAEQEDWFEPELEFVRRWFRPGMRAIDVGANHGVFALTLARLAGEPEAVTAVEPGAEVAQRLRRSIERNGVHCRLVQAAVADQPGEATLRRNGGCELATLDRQASGAGETVAVVTLDGLWRVLGEPALDFVKLDVEGFEAQAIAGGSRLLDQARPLMMFEISGAAGRLAELGPLFDRHGYALYRLLPEPGILVPAVAAEISAFQLNLFACHADRAAALAAEGRLLATVGPADLPDDAGIRAGLATLGCWSARDAERLDGLDAGSPVGRALRSRAAPAGIAIADLCAVATAPGHEARAGRSDAVALLSSLARCAAALGWRERALGALGELNGLLAAGRDGSGPPFVPALPRYDQLDPGDDRAEWLRMMSVEGLVTLHSHSTRFGRGDALGLLERWRGGRFFPAALERRRQLLSIRLGLQAGLLRTDPIRREPGLNAGLYR